MAEPSEGPERAAAVLFDLDGVLVDSAQVVERVWRRWAGEQQIPADEILAVVGDGLYVQSVTGIHSGVNAVSGDFSVGAEGLTIRGGTLDQPVREVTVASTLQRMLQSIVAVGRDLRWLPGVAAGQTLAIGDMQLSGE